MDIALAVIGGTGVYRLAALEDVEARHVDTPYGAPSGPLRIGRLGEQRIAFLARHGEGHALPPHRVNYRANLHALRHIGARRVLALNTVGGITDGYGPRVLACPDQLIDYTWGRESTFWDGEGEALHVDFGHPYSPMFRHKVLAAARVTGARVVDGGCYGATGARGWRPTPRSRACAATVATLVGMTGMPEAALARELGLEYACLAIVANWAAGCGDAREITLAEVLDNVAAASSGLPELVAELARG
ncbi:S-methyl-5'-thioinosine phosphorylase [Pseudoxanthomonas sp. NC8]|nr:S-methyl-5'-thioinosine phosphorylase [Pseudoxanthomonas sp. NC8]